MSVLKLKPHSLSYLTQKDGYEDENGDYHKGESVWSDEFRCDAVPSGEAGERTFEDGVSRKYSYTLYLDKDCPELNVGQKVMLSRNGKIAEYDVKGFHRYQHQAMAWI
jgi:hypothetical protein